MKGVLRGDGGEYDCIWGDFESDEAVSQGGGTFTKFVDFFGYIDHSNSIVIIPEEFI